MPILAISATIGPGTALGAGIGTTFLSVGNALTFGCSLAMLPSEQRFEEFRQTVECGNEGTFVPDAG